MLTKQCHECYKELELDNIFCPRCGVKLLFDEEIAELDLADIYRAVIRLEGQLKEQGSSPQLMSRVYQQQMLANLGMQSPPIRKKKKSSFSFTSVIITILIILIMISLSFIGTVFVNVHVSGYTKSSGQVVNEILDMFTSDGKQSTETDTNLEREVQE